MLVRSVNKIGKKDLGCPLKIVPAVEQYQTASVCFPLLVDITGKGRHFTSQDAMQIGCLKDHERCLLLSGARQGESQAQNYKELPHHWYFQ